MVVKFPVKDYKFPLPNNKSSAEDVVYILAGGPWSDPTYPFVWVLDIVYHLGILPNIQSSRKCVGYAL